MGLGPLAYCSNALAFIWVCVLQDIPHKKSDPPFEALVKKERTDTGNDTDDYCDDDNTFCRSKS